MGRIAEQEQAPVLHRFHHKTAQGRDAFFDGGAGDQLFSQSVGQPGFQFRPEAFVRPFAHRLLGRYLQVIAAARR